MGLQKDYSSLQLTAKRLIQRFGRQITLQKLQNEGAKPWEGVTDPVTVAENLSVYAVQAQPTGLVELGLTSNQIDLVSRQGLVFIVEPIEGIDFTTYNAVLDGSIQYKIQEVSVLMPASKQMLAYIGVNR
jgi:hypothetical protein